MLIRFLLLTLGVWCELGYFVYLLISTLIIYREYILSKLGFAVTASLTISWNAFVDGNLYYGKFWMLFVIPSVLAAIVLMLQLLVTRPGPGDQR